jgi:hypothetical protein
MSGTPLTCANCGNEVREGARFCGNCGAPMAEPDEQRSSGELPPTTSSTRRPRLLWVAAGVAVALLLAGGGVAAALAMTGGGGSSQDTVADAGLDSITNTTDVFPTDDATTEPSDAIGQGVDETCEDIVAFFALAKEVDIARGGNSVDGVEQLAEVASDLASTAPAEPEGGEPRYSFEGIALAYGTYASLLSELDVDPGPDALLEPRIADALADVEIDVVLGVVPWVAERCSAEHKAQLEQLGNG